MLIPKFKCRDILIRILNLFSNVLEDWFMIVIPVDNFLSCFWFGLGGLGFWGLFILLFVIEDLGI